MTYLTYEEYNNLGGVCDITAFNRNINRVSSIIDTATHNRIENMETIPNNAKMLCMELVDYYSKNSNTAEKDVSSWSESAGAVSESVSYVSKTTEDINNDVYNLIYDYLSAVFDDNGTPLLYKGAMI